MTTSVATAPLASIVIVNYNYARFLPAAIDSALNQTHPHVEVIIIDDGSTDDSPQIIHRYGTGISFLLKQNEGADAGRNGGVEARREPSRRPAVAVEVGAGQEPRVWRRGRGHEGPR